jgi:predicted N-formylglutamate amidohydrolase
MPLQAAILSVHSFNATYPGMAPGSRDFEVGVLCTVDDALAEAFR